MQQTNNQILLATDGSKHAQAALDSVLSRPWIEGTSIHVVHVVDQFQRHLASTDRLGPLHHDQLIENAIALCSAKFGSEHVRGSVLPGDAKRILISLVKETNPDLLVLGSHGDHGIGGLLLGSVTNSVIDHTDCSVLVVRKPHPLKGAVSIERLLVAIDNTEFSEAAIDCVARQPWDKNTVIKLTSVVQPPITQFSESPPIDARLAIAELQALAVRCQKLISAKISYLKDYLPENEIVGICIEEPDVASAILEIADQYKPDLIIVGSHGRRGFDQLLIGSVSKAIVMHANCSVEVVRKPEFISRHRK